jgi:hypothetical protein
MFLSPWASPNKKLFVKPSVDFATTYHLLTIRYSFVLAFKYTNAYCVSREEVHSIQNFFGEGPQAFLGPRSPSPLIKILKMFILNRLNYCVIFIVYVIIRVVASCVTQNSRLCATRGTGFEHTWLGVKLGYSGNWNSCV